MTTLALVGRAPPVDAPISVRFYHLRFGRVELSFTPATTLGQIRVALEESLGIPRSWQSSFTKCFDGGFHADLGVPPFSVDSQPLRDLLPLPAVDCLSINSRHGPIRIYNSATEVQTIAVDIFPVRDSVLRAKLRIEANEGIPISEQRLLFHGRELANEFRLADLPGSTNGDFCPLRMAVIAGESMDIGIQAKDGETMQLCVRRSDSIWEVKRQIEAMRARWDESEGLFLGGADLRDELVLGDYAIMNHATLHLCGRSVAPGEGASESEDSSSIEVTLNDFDEGTIRPVRVCRSDRISTVGRGVGSEFGPRVFLGAVMLDTGKSFADYGIGDGLVLHLQVRIEIVVRTLSGKEMRFLVLSTLVVHDLKVLIAHEYGADVNGQRLLWGHEGRVETMDDWETLQHYSIPSGAMIHLVLRMKGG
jgi:hypothetical protein